MRARDSAPLRRWRMRSPPSYCVIFGRRLAAIRHGHGEPQPRETVPITNDPQVATTSGDRPSTPLLASPELRVCAVTLVAALALGLAVVLGLARWSDRLMLDFRRWHPSTTVKNLGAAALAAYFDRSQTAIPEQRPFRLALQLPPTARVGDVMAAEGWVSRSAGRHCFFVLAFPSRPASGAASPLASSARVWVGGRLAASFPVGPADPPRRDVDPRRRDVRLDGVTPARGGVPVRFEIVAEPAPPGALARPAAVQFEMATLRRCDR